MCAEAEYQASIHPNRTRAIISLLAALLSPALKTAREMARQTVCLNNLKQIGTAIMMYANDYNDYYPRACAPDWSDFWFYAIDRLYLGNKGVNPQNLVWGCPSRGQSLTGGDPTWCGTGGYSCTDLMPYLSSTYVRTSRVDQPALIPLLAETRSYLGFSRWVMTHEINYPDHARFVHNGNAVMFFCDGHTTVVKERAGKWNDTWFGNPFPEAPGSFGWQ